MDENGLIGPNPEIQTCQNSGWRDTRLDSRGNWVECAFREGKRVAGRSYDQERTEQVDARREGQAFLTVLQRGPKHTVKAQGRRHGAEQRRNAHWPGKRWEVQWEGGKAKPAESSRDALWRSDVWWCPPRSSRPHAHGLPHFYYRAFWLTWLVDCGAVGGPSLDHLPSSHLPPLGPSQPRPSIKTQGS